MQSQMNIPVSECIVFSFIDSRFATADLTTKTVPPSSNSLHAIYPPSLHLYIVITLVLNALILYNVVFLNQCQFI